MNTRATLCLMMLTLLGCADETAEQRDHWNSTQPDTYVAELCGTGSVAHDCTRVAVQHGMVVKQSQQDFRDPTKWSSVPITDIRSPLDAAFDVKDDMKDCTLKREFDSSFGFVRQNYFDCGGEGSGTRVECFVPNTLDLDACPTM